MVCGSGGGGARWVGVVGGGAGGGGGGGGSLDVLFGKRGRAGVSIPGSAFSNGSHETPHMCGDRELHGGDPRSGPRNWSPSPIPQPGVLMDTHEDLGSAFSLNVYHLL